MTELQRAGDVTAFEYVFYKSGSMEDVAASIKVDEPLPHIELGNSVGLVSTVAGFHLRIVHIEVDLHPAELGSRRPIVVHVYTQNRDRHEIIPILRSSETQP
jgi:hypothetical protein